MNQRSLLLVGGMAAAVLLTIGAMITSTADGETVAPQINAPAPAFSGLSSTGQTVSLSDFAGKTVVLEWTNHDCPFVRKHYDTAHSNMQAQQAAADAGDVVWLTLISSAPGKQGHVTAEQANELTTSRGASPDHVILDTSGEIGRLYDARTTPHMYVIGADGALAYNGAIDSIASARVTDIPQAVQYVTASLDALAQGRAPDPATTKAYGCSVKY